MENSNQGIQNKVSAVYMRVSTANQEEEGTIENQWVEIRARIEKDAVQLSKDNIYQDDGYTGTILKRPALDQLRHDAALGKFNTLYVYDRGRLSRVFIHQEILLDELRKRGITVNDGVGNGHFSRV